MDLFTAIDRGNISVIKQHIDAGTNINDFPTPFPEWISSAGNGALAIAVLNDNAEIVQLLLDNGADIEFKGKNGATPLHWAALSEEMVSLLNKYF